MEGAGCADKAEKWSERAWRKTHLHNRASRVVCELHHACQENAEGIQYFHLNEFLNVCWRGLPAKPDSPST
jgi:hypothetical protein